MVLKKLNRAIFLDRDGIINKVLLNNGKPFSPRRFDEFKMLGGIETLLTSFKNIGFLNIIVTNQPDISRGLMKMEELDKMHLFIRERLPVDDILVCTHDDIHNCGCRKPKAGMIIKASEKWDIDLRRSFMVGDTWKDMKAGKSAGCRTVLVDMEYNQDIECDHRVKGLEELVEIFKLSDKRSQSVK